MSEGVKSRLRSSQQTHLGEFTEDKDAQQQAGGKRCMTGQQDKQTPVKKAKRNKASEALQRAVASTTEQEEHAKAAQHKRQGRGSTLATGQAGAHEQGKVSNGQSSSDARDVRQGSTRRSKTKHAGSEEQEAEHGQDCQPSKQARHSSSQQQQGSGGQQQGGPASKSPAAKGERRAEQADEAPKANLPDSVKAEALKTVHINRAPVLTLWVACVAQREGFSRAAGLSFGKAISGMLAQSKGRSLGLMQPKDRTDEERAQQRGANERAGFAEHEVFGMHILAKEVDDDGDVRALDSQQQVVKDSAVQGYLKRAFGDRLQDAEATFKELADAYEPGEIGSHAYRLYERFRPTVQSGTGGWGQKGELDLEKIRSMAAEHRH